MVKLASAHSNSAKMDLPREDAGNGLSFQNYWLIARIWPKFDHSKFCGNSSTFSSCNVENGGATPINAKADEKASDRGNGVSDNTKERKLS